MSKNMFSGIRDNYLKESAGDFLKDKIQASAHLSFVSAYFTIYAQIVKQFPCYPGCLYKNLTNLV